MTFRIELMTVDVGDVYDAVARLMYRDEEA